MLSPAAIGIMLHAYALQALCATGISAGVAMFLCGLRPGRKQSKPAVVPLTLTPARPDSEPRTPRLMNPVKVIRLTPEARALKAADMTQQGKIAAALTRAEVSNGVGQTPDAGPANHMPNIQLITTQLEKTRIAADPRQNLEQDPPAAKSYWKHALLWTGAALAVLSLYFLLKSFR